MSKINIINASAGSGKTYTLTKLASENICSEKGISAEQLFATTFTIKAADELSARLRLSLLSANKLDAVNLISEGFVGTVNSVCARLLTQYAIDAGLSPAIEVIPEQDMERIFNKAVRDATMHSANKLEKIAQKFNRNGGGSKEYPWPDWQSDVKKIANLARANRLSPADLMICAEKSKKSFSALFDTSIKYDVSDLVEAAKSAIHALEEFAKSKNLNKPTQAWLDQLKEIKNNPAMLDELTWKERAKERTKFPPSDTEMKNIAKLFPTKDYANDLIAVQKQFCNWVFDPLLREEVKIMIDEVFHCAALSIEHYPKYKKEHGLMDFTDQESGVLDLLEDDKNQKILEELKERLSLMLVDEFQDTSPIQLSIFLKLNELCNNSYWVGDPKQSIYGFRGSDPILMEKAVESFSKKAGKEDSAPLDESWRSKELLVQFSNAIFKNIFRKMDEEGKVQLKIPSDRKTTAQGGVIETWILDDAKSKEKAANRLAIGIKYLLSNIGEYQEHDLKPKDIAVLCRSNSDCDAVANALDEQSIRASTPRGDLIKTPVCRVVLAAMRYLADSKDTLAVIELINFLPDYADNKDWLAKLLSNEDSRIYLEEIKKSKTVFKKLDAKRTITQQWTPSEIMEFCIEATDVIEAAALWPNTPLALANLDKLRQTCIQYLDLCKARHDCGSLSGYFLYLKENKIKEAEGSDEQTVQVLTYHKAKGLEWKVVILYNLDTEPRGSAFNISAQTEGEFNPQKPLANRTLHFWPNPLGKQSSDELDALLETCPQQKEAVEHDVKERQRLLYVGITRAMNVLILAAKRTGTELHTTWLDVLTDSNGKKLIDLPVKNDNGKPIQNYSFTIGDTPIAMTVREYSEQESEPQTTHAKEIKYRPIFPKDSDITEFPAMRYSGSTLKGSKKELSEITINELVKLGDEIKEKEKPDYASLGNAVHNFLSLVQGKRSSDEWKHVAQRLLTRYGVDKVITDADMIAVYARLNNFIKTNYPNAKILRECPISLREANNQVMHGFIDMLLELDEGYVIIDHKTFAGAGIAKEEARKYAPQLNAYRRAVEAATNKKVIATLIHMPIIGIIYEVKGYTL